MKASSRAAGSGRPVCILVLPRKTPTGPCDSHSSDLGTSHIPLKIPENHALPIESVHGLVPPPLITAVPSPVTPEWVLSSAQRISHSLASCGDGMFLVFETEVHGACPVVRTELSRGGGELW